MRNRCPSSISLLALLAAGVLAPCLPLQGSGRPRSEPELRTFYHQACAGCHGADGAALAPDGRKLQGRDFTAMQAMWRMTDQALAKTIREGVFFGLRMPSFKQDLSEEEAVALVRDILRKARKGESIHSPVASAGLRQASAAQR